MKLRGPAQINSMLVLFFRPLSPSALPFLHALPPPAKEIELTCQCLCLFCVPLMGCSRPDLVAKLDTSLWTWLHRAAYNGTVEVVEYLLNCNKSYVESLVASNKAGKSGIGGSGASSPVPSLPSPAPSVASSPRPSSSPLGTASSPAPTILGEHASKVVAVNQQDVFGRTALHVASSSAIVKSLLDYNRKVSKLISENMPKASPEIKLLLCVDADLQNTKGQTPLLCFVRRSDEASIALLLEAGANPNIQDDYKLACLQMVCTRVDPNKSEKSHASTPSTSSHSHHTSSSPSRSHSGSLSNLIVDTSDFTKALSRQAKELIIHGSDISLMDLYGENVLHYACRRADMELLQTILHQGRLKQGDKVLIALRTLYKDGRLSSSISSRLECCDLLNNAFLSQVHRLVEANGLSKLTATEVSEWLISIGLSSSRDLFLKNAVTGAFLATVSEETIKRDLGLESLAQRSTFINRLEELKDMDSRRRQRSGTPGFGEKMGQLSEAVSGLQMAGSAAKASKEARADLEQTEEEDDDAELLGLPNAKDYEIQYEDLIIGEEIGRGNFGEVRRGQWKAVLVALKTIYRTGGDTAPRTAVFREMGILAQLRHPNILGFLGYVKVNDVYLSGGLKAMNSSGEKRISNSSSETPSTGPGMSPTSSTSSISSSSGSVMMVTDLMTGGSMHNMIKSSFETVTRLRFKLVSGIVRGMVYLHHRKLVHRDLNTKNILLDDHYSVKISDFGLSRPKNDHKMTMSVGFLGGMAPEVYKGQDYTDKADVFSFAMVVYEIITGKESHHAQANVMMYAHNMATNNYRPPLDDLATPTEWNSLIRKCWASDPAERPSFAELLEIINAMEQAHARILVPISITESGAYLT